MAFWGCSDIVTMGEQQAVHMSGGLERLPCGAYHSEWLSLSRVLRYTDDIEEIVSK